MMAKFLQSQLTRRAIVQFWLLKIFARVIVQFLIVLQCVAVCCSVLQCVAVCCSVLQCVAVCCCAIALLLWQKFSKVSLLSCCHCAFTMVQCKTNIVVNSNERWNILQCPTFEKCYPFSTTWLNHYVIQVIPVIQITMYDQVIPVIQITMYDQTSCNALHLRNVTFPAPLETHGSLL